MKLLQTLIVLSTLTGGLALAQVDPCALEVPSPIALASDVECSQCKNFLLPGRLVPSTSTVYTIHSDLPEMFTTPGVLYSTEAVRPPFLLKNGTPLSEEMRTQKNAGFSTIDGNFEVFVFHISQPGDGSTPRRVVVYARNTGTAPVTITPRQAIVTDGTIGTQHEMESVLGRRVLGEAWDRPIANTTIAPGKGEVVAFSKKFPSMKDDADSSKNVNCFGIVKADVKSGDDSTTPSLQIFIVGIPADGTDEALTPLAEKYLDRGANSLEDVVDLTKEPVGCQLRRATGVMKSSVYRADELKLDIDRLVSTPIAFQMAVPEVQSTGCPAARQTADLILYPPAARPDSVGNYMMEYEIPIHLVNKHKTAARTFDVRFGKNDADIGLVWQVARDGDGDYSSAIAKATPRTGWAGPRQTEDGPDNTRSFFLEEDGPIVVGPCEEEYLALRFMVLGNSSLPFQIHAVAKDASGATD